MDIRKKGFIDKCPRCLESLGEKTLEECIEHVNHCIWCQEMDEKLYDAERDYYKKLGLPPGKIPYKPHNQNPNIYTLRRNLIDIKEGRK